MSPTIPTPTRRRRLLDRLSRISSSPQLTPSLPSPSPPPHHNPSASTPTLPLPSKTTQTVEIPYGPNGDTLTITIPVPPRDHFTPLPPELKLCILQYLSPRELVRASGTSRDFAALSTDGQLWKVLDTSSYYGAIPASQLAELITSAGPFIRHLNLRGCRQLASDWRQDSVYNAPRHLQSVNLDGAQPSRSALQFLIVRNPALRRLTVPGCRALTNSVCRLIAQSLPVLEEADISWCSGISSSGLRKLLEGCAGSLKVLTARGVAGFEDSAVCTALWRTNGLVELDMSSCPNLGDDSVRTLCTGPAGSPPAAPRKLQRMAMASCSRISDAALHVLAAHAPHLTSIELAGNGTLNDGGMSALFDAAKGLTHVDIDGCIAVTDASLLVLARHGNVRYLNVGSCGEVSDAGVVGVMRRCKVAGVEADGTRVGDGVLEEAVRSVRYRGLQDVKVAVYDCPAVTWEGIRAVLVQNTSREGGKVVVKCFYGWQGVVDAHQQLCESGELEEAERVERGWAKHMGAEDGGEGRRRRRGGNRIRDRGRCVIC